VITTVFSTRWPKKALLSLLAAFMVLALASGLGAPRAHAADVDASQMRLEKSEDGIYLSGNVAFELPALVEDALLKGIPMYFVAEAELYRDRWYWYDRKVATSTRHMRLAYQPLTGRWRLNVSPTIIRNAGLGVTLNQNFDNLTDALAAVQRITRWKIADVSEFEADGKHNIDFRFRLDVSQLPRPFQIGSIGQSDWSIAVQRNLRLENGK
jgi:hypothetical protein